MRTRSFTILFLALLFCSINSAAQKEEPISKSVDGHIFKPAAAEPTEENVKKLKLPDGFVIKKYAENLGKPRMIASSPKGYVYVSRRDSNDVVLLRDDNDDGTAERHQKVASIKQAHGLTVKNGKLYIAAVTDVYEAAIKSDGTLETPKQIINGLPDGGQHPNRTLAFGPDNLLYLTVGSTCNACKETNDEAATVLQISEDFSSRKIFAKGLRNTIGFDWHPVTKKMYGMDHGIDWLGDEEQKEELNHIVESADYGWPHVYGNGKHNVADEPPGNVTFDEYAAKTKQPELLYTAHSSPLGMVFYTGSMFPDQYRNSAFITMHGSWNRKEPVGYKVVLLKFNNGKPDKFEDFLTGFLINNNKEHFGRVCGITQHNDGSLLITDDAKGVVYRVSYQK